MIAQLRVTPAAELDIASAFTWYERQRIGLGIRFVEAIDTLARRIRESPGLFPEVAPGVRRGLLRRFPYGVYFSATSEYVLLHAVLHQHRDPSVARRRLSDGST